jgi:hypothetical protein
MLITWAGPFLLKWLGIPLAILAGGGLLAWISKQILDIVTEKVSEIYNKVSDEIEKKVDYLLPQYSDKYSNDYEEIVKKRGIPTKSIKTTANLIERYVDSIVDVLDKYDDKIIPKKWKKYLKDAYEAIVKIVKSDDVATQIINNELDSEQRSVFWYIVHSDQNKITEKINKGLKRDKELGQAAIQPAKDVLEYIDKKVRELPGDVQSVIDMIFGVQKLEKKVQVEHKKAVKKQRKAWRP